MFETRRSSGGLWHVRFGKKQTCAADKTDVRYVPIADISQCSRRVRFSLDSGHIVVACPTGEKSQQAQTHRGKNVQSAGPLLINNQVATEALRASIMVTEFCVPARRHRPLDSVQILVGAGLMGLALLFFVARLAG